VLKVNVNRPVPVLPRSTAGNAARAVGPHHQHGSGAGDGSGGQTTSTTSRPRPRSSV